jgi:hypothetical protein
VKELYGLSAISGEWVKVTGRADFIMYEKFVIKDGEVVSPEITHQDQLDGALEELERVIAWRPDKVMAAVDPPHYKGYIDDHQWIDAMSRIPTLRDPDNFIAALELQVRKYLDRRGKKDDSLQELKKAQFYLAYMIKYIEKGEASAEDVQTWLKRDI